MKNLKLSFVLMLSIVQFACAVENELQYEIVPFDYEDADMREQLCAMVRDDEEMAARIHDDEESMRNYLSGPDLENKTNCFVCRATDATAKIYGFMVCGQHDVTYISLHPVTGLWFSLEPQADAVYVLIEVMRSVGMINELGIHKDYRGQGIGQAMLKFFQENCKQHGMQQLMLFVDTNNDSAICAYRKFGFEIDLRYNDNIESYTMIKFID